MQFNTRLLHGETSVPTMHGEILPPVSQVSAFRYDSIIRFKGQLTTIISGEGPCYRCIFKNPPSKDAVVS